MAKDKKSFIAYVEWGKTFNELSDEEAGRLVKHLFAYVSDENPEAVDKLTKMCFIPIEQTLKRDLKKYEVYAEKQRLNGQKGGRPKKPEETQKTQAFLEKPKKADNVNVNVNDNITYYRVQDFLKDWNKLRIEHLKKPSNLNRLTFDQKKEFDEICLTYEPEQIRNAMIGLFKQKKFPNDNSVMNSSPKHFLNHFETYLQAYNDKNDSLYGKVE